MSELAADRRRLAYLEALGIEVWLLKEGPRAEGKGPRAKEQFLTSSVAETTAPNRAAESQGTAPRPSTLGPRPSGLDFSELDWPELQARVANCEKCELHNSRTQTVFGVGNPAADLLVVGEAPGADEDRLGEPFVGRAGQLLTAMLRAIGLQRGDVYIANILKCRPPGNRNPSLDEAAACQGYLQRQIALVQPKLILAVGAVAARNLLGSAEPVGSLRRRVHSYGPAAIPVLVSYHPAYLLRQPEEKAKAWEDLQQAARLLG